MLIANYKKNQYRRTSQYLDTCACKYSFTQKWTFMQRLINTCIQNQWIFITMPYNNDIYIVTVHGKIQQPKTKCSVLDDDLSVF